jgi:hypothetical protein
MEAALAYLRFYPEICLEGLRKATKTSVRIAGVWLRFEPSTSGIHESRTLPLCHPFPLDTAVV